MPNWVVETIVHFGADDFMKAGYAHFGFHDRTGNSYAIFHNKHSLGLIGLNGKLEWTVAAQPVFEDVPNIRANLNYPIFIDRMLDGTLVVSNFGDARLYRIDVANLRSELFVDGPTLGLRDAGNCVVDDAGYVWLNEVTGCRIWKFDQKGEPLLTLGDGTPGFQPETAGFDEVRFSWIYDMRRGPDGNLYVLDSKNFAVRMIDLKRGQVRTLAGTGKPGYGGDGDHARYATFGSDPAACFDGPISLSLDEEGSIFVGDRWNHVVRTIEKSTGIIRTIAGKHDCVPGRANGEETDPMNLNLPEISSMDYDRGHLFVPTDITSAEGDLAILRRE